MIDYGMDPNVYDDRAYSDQIIPALRAIPSMSLCLDLDALFEKARAEKINPGYRLGRDYPEYEDGLQVAITELRTKQDIDRLATVVAAAREGVAV